MVNDVRVSEKETLITQLVPIKEYIKEETYDAFIRIINYYDELESMNHRERGTQEYSLTSAYALLLLNSTYDLSIKEIYREILKKSLSVEDSTLIYLTDVINTRILNRQMTNIKHDVVKNSLKISLSEADTRDSILQNSIHAINTLVEARNNIAHSIEVSNKGHNDLKEALLSVLYYLNWYSVALKGKFSLE